MRTPFVPSLSVQAIVAGLAAVAVALPACSSDPSVILPTGANARRNRSVIVDNANCYLTAKGIDGPVPCPDDSVPVGGLVGTGMRGINGGPTPVFTEDYAADFVKNFLQLASTNMRIPVGYGCAYTLQGMWKGGTQGNPDDLKNYDLTAFESVLTAVRNAKGTPLWTAAYDLAENGTCTYANGEQVGKPIEDPVRWAKVVRKIMRHYDRDLPGEGAKTAACLGTTNLPWTCFASIFNIEFGRDPFGAGGYKNTLGDKTKWLNAYRQFATQMREEFPLPGNDVRLVGPSVVMSADPTNTNPDAKDRSPIYDFIDFVVANNLPLTDLSMEIEACTPVQSRNIVKAVADYAAKKGLHYEKQFSLKSGKIPVTDATGQLVGFRSDGSEPIPIWVTDLRFKCKLPHSIEDFPSRKQAYLGAFYAGSKILWQGLVGHATVGTGPRFPTVQLSPTNKAEALATTKDSDFMWFSQSGIADTLLKPSGWYQFWFNNGFMDGTEQQTQGAQQIAVLEGPDAFGLNGTDQSSRESGILLMATRETCRDALGKVANCVADSATSSYPAVDSNRKHRMHVFVVDLDVGTDDAITGLGILEHVLRIEVKGMPKDTKTVGYRWAYMDGTDNTWCKPDLTQTGNPMTCKYEFPEQGLLDIFDGTFHFTRNVGVPSMHYIEFLY